MLYEDFLVGFFLFFKCSMGMDLFQMQFKLLFFPNCQCVIDVQFRDSSPRHPYLPCLASVAWVKSREMHWSLLALKEAREKELNLSGLRMVMVADATNPWSIEACDSFIKALSPRGLRPEALCTTAYSSEALTCAISRQATFFSFSLINTTYLFRNTLTRLISYIDSYIDFLY